MNPMLGTFLASEGEHGYLSQTDLGVNFHSFHLRLNTLGPFAL